MQPRTLEQIISELQPSYQPSIEFLRQRQAEIPKTVESDIQAAQAAQTQAYEDILTGARRRGLGFSGIPLGEQARYASQVFAPAVLQARTRGTEAARDLEGTILGLQAEMRNAAIARRQREQDIATELANASRGGGGSSMSSTDAVLQWLYDQLNKKGNNDNTTKPSLNDIFGSRPSVSVATGKTVPVGTSVQPQQRVNLQAGATAPRIQGAPANVGLTSGQVNLQGRGASTARPVSVSQYLTPTISYVTGPAPGLRVTR